MSEKLTTENKYDRDRQIAVHIIFIGLTRKANDKYDIFLLKPFTPRSTPPSSSSSSTSRFSTNHAASYANENTARPTNIRKCYLLMNSGEKRKRKPSAQTVIVTPSLRSIWVSIDRII